MLRALLLCFLLAGCGGLSWNTTLANDADVRMAMLLSVRPGISTETDMVVRWGNPTQKVREGAETRFIYRDMRNSSGFLFPQFGNSSAFVVIVFQYGIARGAYSSDTEGCRGIFAPRPPGFGFDNPTVVKPVNCGAFRQRVASADGIRDNGGTGFRDGGSGTGGSVGSGTGTNGRFGSEGRTGGKL